MQLLSLKIKNNTFDVFFFFSFLLSFLSVAALPDHTKLAAQRLPVIPTGSFCLSPLWHRAHIVTFFVCICFVLFFLGATPTWLLTRWFCTSFEASTCQLPQVGREEGGKKGRVHLQNKPSLRVWVHHKCVHTSHSHLLPLIAPAGVSPHDLDASVKFEFPFPSVVRDKQEWAHSTMFQWVDTGWPFWTFDLWTVSQ